MRQEPIDKKNKYRFESYIGWNQNWWKYYQQYKQAVDRIVSLVESGTPIDTISLPLLFLVRHSLELGLKANILKLEEVNSKVGKINLKGTKYHSLELLNNKFEEHLNVILKEKKVSKTTRNEILDYLKKFEPLKNTLHNLDGSSANFRYPVDTSGTVNFNYTETVQLADIIEMYYKIQPFILYTENVLMEEGVIVPEL